MNAVLADGIIRDRSQFLANSLPFSPVKAMVLMPISFAFFTASMMFFDLPLVEIAISISFLFASDSSCLAKTMSYPRSLPIAVSIEVLVVRASAEKDFLFFLNLTTNSAAKCWLSAALPPLPQNIIFPLLSRVLMQRFAIFIMSVIDSLIIFSLVTMDSLIIFFILFSITYTFQA